MAERRFVYFYSMFCSAFCLHLFIFHSGVDLKMVTFSCVPTGDRQGIMEMVTNAKTLREIQVTGNQGLFTFCLKYIHSWPENLKKSAPKKTCEIKKNQFHE